MIIAAFGSATLIAGGIFLYCENLITEVEPLKTVQTSQAPAPLQHPYISPYSIENGKVYFGDVVNRKEILDVDAATFSEVDMYCYNKRDICLSLGRDRNAVYIFSIRYSNVKHPEHFARIQVREGMYFFQDGEQAYQWTYPPPAGDHVFSPTLTVYAFSDPQKVDWQNLTWQDLSWNGKFTDSKYVYLCNKVCSAVIGADPATFTPFYRYEGEGEIAEVYLYEKDATHVFYNGTRIDGADAATFTVVSSRYGKDKFFVYDNGIKMSGVNPQKFSPISQDELPISAVIIGTSTDMLRLYTSKEYGFHFLFSSKGWYIGDNCLGCGTFQLSNYDPATADGKDFGPAYASKIEMAIVHSNVNAASIDYPEIHRSENTVIVAGEKAKVFDIELLQGKIRSYYIPLPKKPGLFLAMSIYGNDKNFHILDEIAKSFVFEKILSPEM